MGAVCVDVTQFTDMHFVYRLIDATGRLVYVGMTGDIGTRLKDHAGKAWFLGVTSITLQRFTTYAEAAVAEESAIREEKPLINKVGLSKEESARRAFFRKQQRSEEKIRAAEEKRTKIAEEKRRIAAERERGIREQPPRDLLADLDRVVGQERVRISELPPLLRQLAPGHGVYQSLNSKRLREMLTEHGVRTTNPKNVPTLNPADLRYVRLKAG